MATNVGDNPAMTGAATRRAYVRDHGAHCIEPELRRRNSVYLSCLTGQLSCLLARNLGDPEILRRSKKLALPGVIT
jgi:hypothetical protein